MRTLPPHLDRELVVHTFVPLTGPSAEADYQRIQRSWLLCRQLLGMDSPVPAEQAIPRSLPPEIRQLSPASEAVIAAQQRPDAAHQAVVRRLGDVLNLSVVLSPGNDTSGPTGWADLERHWTTVTGDDPTFLSAARIFQAVVRGHPAEPNPELAREVAPQLPVATVDGWWERGAPMPAGFTVWAPHGAGPAPRWDLMALAPAGYVRELDAWTWSDGSPNLPPLARYLMHSARARWLLIARTSQSPADEVLREVDHARAGMRAALGAAADVPTGPIAEDFRTIDHLARSASEPGTAVSRTPIAGVDEETGRRVLVVGGPDPQARGRMHAFLRSLGLWPVEDEECVNATGEPTPDAIDEIYAGLRLAQTAVILVTPDEVSRPVDGTSEVSLRPDQDVLLRAGLAMGVYANRIVLVVAGPARLPQSMRGFKPIALDDSPRCRKIIANRLKLAGCPVNTTGTEWLEPGLFQDLAAYRASTGP
ncbi:CATRA conflict system CASPASE/TPR repeat-associated protein [Micromonospora haikouensis]|uniref:CATRA conflict system CASPASE/TPR repeat-associated protein n=1 Tax=Micromonospora haikouensis TaxID=686309 RepID=UPI0036B8B639